MLPASDAAEAQARGFACDARNQLTRHSEDTLMGSATRASSEVLGAFLHCAAMP